MVLNLPRFNQSASDIETGILQVIRENQQFFLSLRKNESQDAESLIKTLEAMDANLGNICAPIQHMFNVYPKQEYIDGYSAVMAALAEYANSIMCDAWLQAFIQAMLNETESVVHQAILKQYQFNMVMAGCFLDEDKQEELTVYQTGLNERMNYFEQNIQQSLNVIFLEGKEIILDESQFLNLMKYESSDVIKKNAYEIYNNKASKNIIDNESFDNMENIIEILNLRRNLSQLYGYNSYWHFSLSQKKFAQTDEIIQFLEQVLIKCKAKCQLLINEILPILPPHESMTPWSINYYLNQYIEQKHQINLQEIAAFFSLDDVTHGLYMLCEDVFNIDLKQVFTIETWHPDIVVFEIKKQGELLGYLYADFFIRSHKRSSSWVDTAHVRRKCADHHYQVPVIFLNCNFIPPVQDVPCLLSHDNLITLLHEFGHAIHYILSGNDYASLNGINGMALDEIEIPSMFFEKFALDKAFIFSFARHYKTGEKITEEQVNKIIAAQKIMAPFKLMDRLRYALLDYALHSFSHNVNQADVLQVAKDVWDKTTLFSADINQADWFKSASLIFTSQYAAGYYGYLWSEAVASDFFYTLKDNRPLNRYHGQLLKKVVLSPGGLFTLDAACQAICDRPFRADAFFHYRNIY